MMTHCHVVTCEHTVLCLIKTIDLFFHSFRGAEYRNIVMLLQHPYVALTFFFINIHFPYSKFISFATFSLNAVESIFVVSWPSVKEWLKAILFERVIFQDGFFNTVDAWNSFERILVFQYLMFSIIYIFKPLLRLKTIKFSASMCFGKPRGIDRSSSERNKPDSFHIVYTNLFGFLFLRFLRSELWLFEIMLYQSLIHLNFLNFLLLHYTLLMSLVD